MEIRGKHFSCFSDLIHQRTKPPDFFDTKFLWTRAGSGLELACTLATYSSVLGQFLKRSFSRYWKHERATPNHPRTIFILQ